MDIKQIYREETENDVYTVALMEQRVEHFSNDYVKWLEKQLRIGGVMPSNCYKSEEFSIYTPKDDEDIIVIEDNFKHKRTFDIDDFNKLMNVLHSVQDY